MSERMPSLLWKVLSVVLYILSAATAIATLYALTVRTTLAAVESAFGSFVLLIMLLVFARKCWEKGRGDPANAAIRQGDSPGKRL